MSPRPLIRQLLVLATGLAAALPVIVSTIQAVEGGWLPLGDRATIAVRSYDVLSTHPPLLGQYSASSTLIDEPVMSPGPLLYWLLAIPVRLGHAAPAVAMGLVNTGIVVAIVALARRRGGLPLMFGAGAGIALMCASLDAATLHDVWNPASGLLPFALVIFLAWSLAAGEHRLLPVTALVASFALQAQLTYTLPTLALLAVSLAFVVRARSAIRCRWVVATLAVLVVCWSAPLVEQVIHRPGNVERIAQVATADGPTLGASAGRRSVVRAVGVPPWWLSSPREPLARAGDVTFSPGPVATATAVLMIVALAGVAVTALRLRRREVAVPALLALALLPALAAVTARTPTTGFLFGTVGYTLLWASPAGMFAWLALAWSLVSLLGPARRFAPVRARLRAIAPAERPAARRLLTAAALAAVAGIGGAVAAGGRPDRLEGVYGPAATILDRVRAEVAPGANTLVRSSPTTAGFLVEAGVAYELRRSGVRVLTDLRGIGTHYDPGRHPHGRVLRVIDGGRPRPRSGRVIARALLRDVPTDALPRRRRARTVIVTLGLR